MALVDVMERCNFVSAGTETEATGHFTLSERRGLVVKELDLQSEVRGQRNSCLKKLVC